MKNGTTVTVTGKLDPDFNPDFVEQRIINPDMDASSASGMSARSPGR